MPLTLITVPCLQDNYAFILADPDSKEAAVIDVPEAGPINAVLRENGWVATFVLLTHHHWDHIDGLPDLERSPTARIIGAAADRHRLPELHTEVSEGDVITVLGEPAHVLDVSGHTVGHIAFHFPQSEIVFTGDSLMAMGCGRLFEGTPEQMWESMQKLRRLNGSTTVCSGHEYTLGNARFALSLEEDNPALTSRYEVVEAARDQNQATVPSNLSDECATNPFLRADDPGLMAAVGMANATPDEVFAAIRSRKDNF